MLPITLIIFFIVVCWLRMTERFSRSVKIVLVAVVTLLTCGILMISAKLDAESYPKRLQRQAEDFYGSMTEEEYDELMQQVDDAMTQ